MSKSKSLLSNRPQKNGEVFSFRVGEVTLECTPKNSGRITLFSHKGKNVLTDASIHPFNFGSTFWTAPQSDWDWPPPIEVDSEASWEGLVEGETVVLNGHPCDKLGVRISKRISVNTSRDGFEIQYSIENVSDMQKSFAHWEISRVKPGGMTFFPYGGVSYPPPAWQKPLSVREMDGVIWFVHSDDTVLDQHKLFADGKEGWIAHVDDNLLFVKSFQDEPPEKRAPSEAEIEIYAIKEYVEVEQQGAYDVILPGATRSWPVTWYLREIPNGIERAPGSASLLRFVREIASGNSSSD
jgi:hypothetical protein